MPHFATTRFLIYQRSQVNDFIDPDGEFVSGFMFIKHRCFFGITRITNLRVPWKAREILTCSTNLLFPDCWLNKKKDFWIKGSPVGINYHVCH